MKLAYVWIAVLLALPFLECLCVDCGDSMAACENCYDSSPADSHSHLCLEILDYYSISANTIEFTGYFQCFYQRQFSVLNLRKYNLFTSKVNPYLYRVPRKHNLLSQVIQV